MIYFMITNHSIYQIFESINWIANNLFYVQLMRTLITFKLDFTIIVQFPTFNKANCKI